MKPSIIPKKSLGQNFLINPRILDKIVAAAEINKEDIVLEIGPGTGNLTQKLSEKAGKVVAIEKDRRLIKELQEKFKNTNVEIVESDILKLKIETLIENLKLKIENYKIVGNIPYYITSYFLRTIFDPVRSSLAEVPAGLAPLGASETSNGVEKWPRPKLIVLTIQKEVAQRIMAKPPKMNLLAVSVQFFAEPKIIGFISKENFRPRPKVDSAIIKLMPKEKLPADNPEWFFKIVRVGFSQKRKLLISNLEKLGLDKNQLAAIFEKLKINQSSRAENLDLENWINLANELKLV